MDKQKLMKEIEANIKSCTKCRLYKTATKAVPGEGNINSKVIFIGEAPGYNEDVSGKPFVGRAGKLLDESLKEIGYKREDIWIGNIIKHRPPDNREPLPDEIRACTPYLDMQLDIISPVMIVTLGRYAMNYFYPGGKISQDRGNLIKAGKYYIYPVYHPAAGLRSTNVLMEFKKDFAKIPEILEKAEDLIKKGQDISTSEFEGEDLDGQLFLDL
jgi:DNA polymerase